LLVHAIAFAPGASERAVDVDIEAQVGALGRVLVRRHHVIDQRFDECCFLRVQVDVAWEHGIGGSRGLLYQRLRWRTLWHSDRSRGATSERRFQESPAFALPVVHGVLLS